MWAPQLQPVLIQDNQPVQNQLAQADINALNDPDEREYIPWRALESRGSKILVQWLGYSRSDATWEEASSVPSLT